MNDKSIVVIKTPKNCRVCPFRQSPWTFCLGEYEKEKHCPLRPLPKKYQEGIEYDIKKGATYDDYLEVGCKMGWDACIDEITGESNNVESYM